MDVDEVDQTLLIWSAFGILVMIEYLCDDGADDNEFYPCSMQRH